MVENNNNIFKISHNDLQPKPGRLLISEPFLQDSSFKRSVVLLVEHSTETGSLGFILNKKTSLTVNSVIPELRELPDIPIYLGGPVASDRLFFIHSLGDLVVPNSVQITDNLFFDGDFEMLKRFILAGNEIADKVKFFIGYSGWETQQLKKEIKADSWAVGMPDDNHVLNDSDESLWKHSVFQLGEKYHQWIHFPKDPYLN